MTKIGQTKVYLSDYQKVYGNLNHLVQDLTYRREVSMKIKFISITAILLLLSIQISSAPTSLMKIKSMDVNKDKRITLEEYENNILERFSSFDGDGNGMISLDEFMLMSSKRFEKIDLNSDDIIEKKELRKASKKIKRSIKKKRKESKK